MIALCVTLIISPGNLAICFTQLGEIVTSFFQPQSVSMRSPEHHTKSPKESQCGKAFICIIQNGHQIYTIILHKSVDVRKLQVAILARSSREMSLTDRILPRYFLSRVRVSVRPRIFYTRKKTKPIVNTESPACCLFCMQMSLHDWTKISPCAPNSTVITA